MRKLKPAERIYKAFYNERKDKLYFNQLKELTGIGDSSLANVLRTLKQNKEIEPIKSKANTFYKLKDKAITKISFTLFDHEKLESLENNIKIPVKKFLSEIPKSIGFIILFGSASRKQERKDSDIDILVALHEFNNTKLQKEYEQERKDRLKS
jgi:predicted nucleotidyltransferase